jgi:hypothetical protein
VGYAPIDQVTDHDLVDSRLRKWATEDFLSFTSGSDDCVSKKITGSDPAMVALIEEARK